MEKYKNFLRTPLFVRNFIFGVEDSLVSTVGLLSGVSIAGVSKTTIFLTGMVLIFVEALSMGAGSFLSENSAETYAKKSEVPVGTMIAGGLVMFFSYFFAGFVPLLPYILLDPEVAFWISIGISLVSLFVLGAVSARVSHIRLLPQALKMFIVGGSAIIIGVIVGLALNGVEL